MTVLDATKLESETDLDEELRPEDEAGEDEAYAMLDPEDESSADPLAKVVDDAASAAASPEDAQRHFEERKAALAWQIADGHIQLADSKARVKSLTKMIDTAVESLEELIEDGPEKMPLFDAKNEKPQESMAETKEDDRPLFDQPAEVAADTDNDAWRSILIQVTSIPTAICKILNEENQVYTLGQLADVTSQPGSALTDLHKIGQAKADKIEEAMQEYWAANPRK